MDAIHRAVEKGRFDEVAALIEADPTSVNLHAKDDSDQPLHFAAWKNRAEIATYLIDHGAEINGLGKEGQTPLHYAAHHGRPKCVRLLVARGALLDALDEGKFTPAFHAVRQGYPKIARQLIKSGSQYDINLAVCLGDLARVEEIVSKSADAVREALFPNELVADAVVSIRCELIGRVTSAKAGSSEHLRVLKEADGILRLLLSHGAPVGRSQFGAHPLFDSCSFGHPYITQLLLENGADPNVKHHHLDLGFVLKRSKCQKEMYDLLRQYGYKGGMK